MSLISNTKKLTNTHHMKNIDPKLLKFAQAQQPVADPFEPTSKRDWALFILLSPIIALGGWVFLLILCMKEGN